jgi:hypothetical protein
MFECSMYAMYAMFNVRGRLIIYGSELSKRNTLRRSIHLIIFFSNYVLYIIIIHIKIYDTSLRSKN